MEKGEKQEMKQFITFEGIDGSGKSTISKLVFDKLKSEAYNVILTYEPTDTEIGKYVQKCIKTKNNPFITAFTFIADRILHCKQIKKWLDDGKIVICDRYADSTYSYQGAQLSNQIKNPIKWLQELSENHILTPDRTFLFIISPNKALTRIQKRNELIPFEKVSFLEKVHSNYLKISNDKRFLKLDATKKIDELVDICYKDILS
jgi:dTMP kinase